MELKELEYIVAIAEEGSISRAADRLYLSQSSLSQFLAKYEAELNLRLFLRTASGARPTYAGDLFVKNAKQILQQYHRMKSELQDIEYSNEGRIELGIATFRGSYLLPSVLRRFLKEYPGVEVVIHEYDSQLLQRKMAAGELDLGLIAVQEGQWPDRDAPVMKDEVYLVATRDHPVMAHVKVGHGGPDRPWVYLEDTLPYEFFLSNHTTVLGSISEALFKQCGASPHAVNDNLTAPFAAAMARQGLGLAFTYRSCAESYANVEYLSIGPQRCFVDLILVYPPDGYRSRAIRALSRMVRQYIAETEGRD